MTIFTKTLRNSFFQIFWLLSVVDANAQTPPTYVEPSGFNLTCYAPHAATGQIVPVAGVNGTPGGYLGFASYNSFGWPVIIFDVNKLSKLPIIFTRFVYYHECAHLTVPTKDEIEANCLGLLEMRKNGHVSREEERILQQVSYSFKNLESKYGGTGKTLWDMTINCAGSR